MSSSFYSPQPTGSTAFGFLQQDDDLITSLYSPATAFYGPPTPPLSSSGSSTGPTSTTASMSMSIPMTVSAHPPTTSSSASSSHHDQQFISHDCSSSVGNSGLYSTFPTHSAGLPHQSGYSPATSFASVASGPQTYPVQHHHQQQHHHHQPYGQNAASYSAFWNTPPPSAELPPLTFSPLVDNVGPYGTVNPNRPSSGYSHSAHSAAFDPARLAMPLHHSHHGMIQPMVGKHDMMQPTMSYTDPYLGMPTLQTSTQNRNTMIPNSVVASATAASTSRVPNRSVYARTITTNTSGDLRAYGYLNKQGTWSCGYPGCTSKAVFTRGCDLRKHYKRHTKTFFCQVESCPQSRGGGFSSRKDLARHEAKHNPGVPCEWKDCERIFSRVDNMRDHVKRIHQKAARQQQAARQAAAEKVSIGHDFALPGVSKAHAAHQHAQSFRSRAGVDTKDDPSNFAARRIVLPSVTLPSMIGAPSCSTQAGSSISTAYSPTQTMATPYTSSGPDPSAVSSKAEPVSPSSPVPITNQHMSFYHNTHPLAV